jgi:hypothetical protein
MKNNAHSTLEVASPNLVESSRSSNAVPPRLRKTGVSSKSDVKSSIHISPGKHRFAIVLIRYQKSNQVAASFEYSSPPSDQDVLELFREKVGHRGSIARAMKKWRQFRRQRLATIIDTRRKERDYIPRIAVTECLGKLKDAVQQFQVEDPKFQSVESRELVTEVRNASWEVQSIISARSGWNYPYGVDDVRSALDEICKALVYLHRLDAKGKKPGHKELAVHIWAKWVEIHAIIGNPSNWGVTQKIAKGEFKNNVRKSETSPANT